MKILVVDDMPLMRHVLINMLRKLQYTDADEATDGKQAFTLLQSKSYDLLITDYHMPHLDGLALLERVRNDSKLSDLPVMMVTCEDNKEDVRAIIKAKVSDIIIKPFSLNTLEKHLNILKREHTQLNDE